MKIKVCGITTVEQLTELEKMKVDFAGLIFVPSSPRYAAMKLSDQKNEVKKTGIKKVGVFVNENIETVLQTIHDYGLSAVQLHGDEDPAYTREVNGTAPAIKAFRISGKHSVTVLTKTFENTCSYFLFDTYSNNGMYGGSGRRFDWSLLREANMNKPFFLSGGISPSHVNDITSFQHPSLFAVDINSRFEKEPGVKDLEMIGAFVKEIRTKNLE